MMSAADDGNGQMLSREEENDAEVRREDQEKINTFGRLNARLYEVREECTELKKKLERLDDASTELMMRDGDKCMLQLGDAFFESTEDDATDYCDTKVDMYQDLVEKLEKEEQEIMSKQQVLKQSLYSRFGKSINLEDK